MCSCGRFNCDPMGLSPACAAKLDGRHREGKCRGCGKLREECSCKSSLAESRKWVAIDVNEKFRGAVLTYGERTSGKLTIVLPDAEFRRRMKRVHAERELKERAGSIQRMAADILKRNPDFTDNMIRRELREMGMRVPAGTKIPRPS